MQTKQANILAAKWLLACALVFTIWGAAPLYAQSGAVRTDTIAEMIHFRKGYRFVEPDFRNNRAVLQQIAQIINNAQSDNTLQSVSIAAWASPEGIPSKNERLAQLRIDSLASWIERNTLVTHDKLQKRSGGIAWDYLRRLVAESDAPYREEVIRIIDEEPIYTYNRQGVLVGSLKKSLMDLQGGRPWNDMMDRFFLDTRSGLTVIILLNRQEQPAAPTEEVEEEQAPAPPTEDDAADLPLPPADTMAETKADSIISKPLFAIKTNLLLDAIVAPNVEVEIPFSNNRWSVMAEYWIPWHIWDKNSKAFQVLYGGLEARRWLGDREKRDVLTGHFLGVYTGAGYYDLEWKGEGYQGELFLAMGLSYGYSHRLNKHLRLEFNVGVGYMKTKYRHYHGMNDNKILVWQNNGRFSWLGPTKAKVSLVWLLYKNTHVK